MRRGSYAMVRLPFGMKDSIDRIVATLFYPLCSGIGRRAGCLNCIINVKKNSSDYGELDPLA